MHLKAAKRLETAAGKVGLGLSATLVLCSIAAGGCLTQHTGCAKIRIWFQKPQKRGSWEAAQRRSGLDRKRRLLREEVVERRGTSAERLLSEEVAQ